MTRDEFIAKVRAIMRDQEIPEDEIEEIAQSVHGHVEATANGLCRLYGYPLLYPDLK